MGQSEPRVICKHCGEPIQPWSVLTPWVHSDTYDAQCSLYAEPEQVDA